MRAAALTGLLATPSTTAAASTAAAAPTGQRSDSDLGRRRRRRRRRSAVASLTGGAGEQNQDARDGSHGGGRLGSAGRPPSLCTRRHLGSISRRPFTFGLSARVEAGHPILQCCREGKKGHKWFIMIRADEARPATKSHRTPEKSPTKLSLWWRSQHVAPMRLLSSWKVSAGMCRMEERNAPGIFCHMLLRERGASAGS